MADKEKAKSRGHPFAGMLNPEEEIVWISPPIPTRTATKPNGLITCGFYLVSYGLLIALIVSACVWVLILGNDVVATIPIVIVAFIVMCMVVMFIGELINQKPYTLEDHFYAVTNERLLYGTSKKPNSLPIEKISKIDLLEREQGRGILVFKEYFMLWPEIEDAAQVKAIIEAARKTRVQAASSLS
jgi:hypothetical protein